MGNLKQLVLPLVFSVVFQNGLGFAGELEDRYAQLSHESGLVHGFSRGLSALSANLCWIRSSAPELGESGSSIGKTPHPYDSPLMSEKIRFFRQILESYDGRLAGLIAEVQTPFLQEDLRRVRVKLADLLQAKDAARSCLELPGVIQALGALEEKLLRAESNLVRQIRSQKSSIPSFSLFSALQAKQQSALGGGVAPPPAPAPTPAYAPVSVPAPTPVLPVPVKAPPRVEKRSVEVQVGPPGLLAVDKGAQVSSTCMGGSFGAERVQRLTFAVTPKSRELDRREEDDPYRLRERVQLDGIGVQIVGLKKLTLNEDHKREFEDFIYASTVGAMKRVDSEYLLLRGPRYTPEISVTVTVNKIDLLLNCLGKFKGYIAEVGVAAEVDRGKTYPIRKLSFSTEIRYKDKGWYQSVRDIGFQSELSSMLLQELSTSLELKPQ